MAIFIENKTKDKYYLLVPGRIFTKAITSLTAKNSANGEPCHGLQKVLLLEGVYLVEPVADLIPRTLPWKWPNDIFCSKKSTKSRSWWNYLAPRMGWRGWTGGWTGCSWTKSSSLQIQNQNFAIWIVTLHTSNELHLILQYLLKSSTTASLRLKPNLSETRL